MCLSLSLSLKFSIHLVYVYDLGTLHHKGGVDVSALTASDSNTKDPLNMAGVGRLLQLCQVQGTIKWGNVCWLSWQALVDRYEHQEEGMTLVIKAQEVFFSTIDNIHSTSINVNSKVVLDLVIPITLWILWKHQCRRVFSIIKIFHFHL